MNYLFRNATVVNQGQTFQADVAVAHGKIVRISTESHPQGAGEHFDEVIDAEGAYLLPGVIDEHVHFRDPGFTHKADLQTESAAAAAGGVTTYFDMPNTRPATVTAGAWKRKMARAARMSYVNYAFYLGASRASVAQLEAAGVDLRKVPGIKLFMGSTTGAGEADYRATVAAFRQERFPVVAHCEDDDIVRANLQQVKARYGDDCPVALHPEIRSELCCYEASRLALMLSATGKAPLHVAHVSTARELELLDKFTRRQTAEVCVPHLLFCDEDYATLGSRIKCNPAIKTRNDRDALRRALSSGRIATIATDHAPHLLSEKEGGALKAVSGMPMVQFSLPAMLTLADEGWLAKERVVELMCHNPARLFGVVGRGFIRKGGHADLVLVRHESHTVRREDVWSKCGWSPLEGRTLHWTVSLTMVNGEIVYRDGVLNHHVRGQAVEFATPRRETRLP